MATYETEVVEIRRYRYRLQAPSNLVEFDKMANAAMREYQEQNKARIFILDDAIRVAVEDDAIVFWWEVQP